MRTVLLSVAVAVAVCSLAGCGKRAGDDAANAAPDYTVTTLDGRPFSLTQMRGEVVLLNVWATWCKPCIEEMPQLQALHERYPRLRVVGASIDVAQADGAVRELVSRTGIDFTILRDPQGLATGAFNAHALPYTVLIDRRGFMRWQHNGKIDADDPAPRERLRTALADGAG